MSPAAIDKLTPSLAARTWAAMVDESSREALGAAAVKGVENALEVGGRARRTALDLLRREAVKTVRDLNLAETVQEALAGYTLEISASLALKPLPRTEPG
ncbi:MAG: hypothetical protein EP330_04570 [Deltaproteobacteria bacterium]|nr:MAG: hypothetical protein EP330_04570 [Deltaproteobacteria bacterium]